MQQMQPLPCIQSTFVDTLKGKRKVVDVNEAFGQSPTKKGPFTARYEAEGVGLQETSICGKVHFTAE